MRGNEKMLKIRLLIDDPGTRFRETDKSWLSKMFEDEIDRVFDKDLARIYAARARDASKPPVPPDPFASLRKKP